MKYADEGRASVVVVVSIAANDQIIYAAVDHLAESGMITLRFSTCAAWWKISDLVLNFQCWKICCMYVLFMLAWTAVIRILELNKLNRNRNTRQQRQ